jgi:glycosyltransferase involved in cell wall biosynthesis
MNIERTASTLFVGSFPPRECGIATFTKDIVESYDAHNGSRSDVVAIDDRSGCGYVYDSRVIGHIKQAERKSYYAAALMVNSHRCSVVNIQHEYGLFGGKNGEWCLDFIGALKKPVVLTLHTVLPAPSSEHALMAQRLCESAARVIVLSDTARRLLVGSYGIAPSKVTVVHHGVPDVAHRNTASAKKELGLNGRTIVSTFGLISSSKGLEYAVAAIHEIAQSRPDVLYLILGATHPLVRRAEGERYRSSLQDRITALGLEGSVRMIGRYLPFDELIAYLQATDVYVTPYLNPDQVVSGTLAYALGAGKAIVSTPYLYARELLCDGRGLFAEFRDSRALAKALERFLSEPAFRVRTQERAYAFGRRMIWSNVAAKYTSLLAAASLTSSAHVLKKSAIAPTTSIASSTSFLPLAKITRQTDTSVRIEGRVGGAARASGPSRGVSSMKRRI